mgnify:CR=1 FL=1
MEAALKDGSLHVFDTSKFTVNGETVTTAPIDLTFYDYSTGTPVAVYQGDTEEAITDGYFSESTLRSAPYFSLRIDGITEDADPGCLIPQTKLTWRKLCLLLNRASLYWCLRHRMMDFYREEHSHAAD